MNDAKEILKKAQDEARDYSKLESEWIDKLIQFDQERNELKETIAQLESSEYHKKVITEMNQTKTALIQLLNEKKQLEVRLEIIYDEKISLENQTLEQSEHITDLERHLKKQDEEVKEMQLMIKRLQSNQSIPINESIIEQDEIWNLKRELKVVLKDHQDLERQERNARRTSDVY